MPKTYPKTKVKVTTKSYTKSKTNRRGKEKLKSVFTQKSKQEMFDKKKALKKDASLVTSPGKNDEPEKKDKGEAWTYDDYVSDRKARSI